MLPSKHLYKGFVVLLYRCIKLWIFTASFSSVFSELITPPQNTAVELGQRAELSCESNSTSSAYLLWYRDVEFSSLCRCGISQAPGFSCYNRTSTSCNVVIENVTSDKAGEYRCESVILQSENSKAQLIVLSTPPQCITSPSDKINTTSSVEMSCNVTYTGSLAPVMTWFDPQSQQMNSTNQNTPGSVEYVTIVTAQIPSVQPHTCRTIFNRVPPSGPGSGSPADNVPSYTSNCSTQTLTVQYPPFRENLTIDGNNGGTYFLGSTLICSAEAIPAVFFYQWYNERGMPVGNNYTLTLDELGQDLNYNCFACNLLGCTQDWISVNVIPVPEITTAVTTTPFSTPFTSTIRPITTTSPCFSEDADCVGLGVGLGLGLGIPFLCSLVVNGILIWKLRSKESKYQQQSPARPKNYGPNEFSSTQVTSRPKSDLNTEPWDGYDNIPSSNVTITQQGQPSTYETLNSQHQQHNEYARLNFQPQTT